ncbi:MAG: hypothetical protein ROO76_22620 [Terriglobia bacterium]|jgi:hypothetical protein|nr:hypothetical protein [Terriglobia bacterium]
MIALRLVRLIEHHSDQLAEEMMRKLEICDKCRELRKVPRAEIEERVREIYRQLSDWLVNKTERDIEHMYRQVARRRFEQGVPLSTVYWAIMTSKENLWDYLVHEGVTENPLELQAGFELIRMMEQFFETAVYYLSLEYEELTAEAARKRTAVAS